jgi:hypothetical protein
MLAEKPSEVHERPSRDFGRKRSEELAVAARHTDYLLVIDADDVLEARPASACLGSRRARARCASRTWATSYERLHLFRSALNWRYVSVLHEYRRATCPSRRASGVAGLVYRRNHDGARWRDPDKYRGDALVLEQGLRDEPGNARYAFYLPQSWRDAGELEQALDAYERRASMGGWDEEVWNALFKAARLRERLGAPHGEVPAATCARPSRPRRAEALCALAR